MKLLIGILVMLSAHAVAAVDYLAEDALPDAARIAGDGDGRLVVIADAGARFRDVTVKSAIKYTLTLEAGFEGAAESIEENPRFEIFRRPGKTSPLLPSCEIRFFDAAGEPAGDTLVHALPVKRSRVYRHVFHSPRTAATMRLTLAPGKDLRLLLRQMKLEEAPDEGALNVNPEFSCGYSGWRNIAAGGRLIERDGKPVLDTKYGSTGRMIPLPGPGTYGFSARATGNGYNSVVIVRVHDGEGKEMMRASTRKYGPVTHFVPPKGAVSVSFLVYSCLLEELRLLRVGDESAIKALRGR